MTPREHSLLVQLLRDTTEFPARVTDLEAEALVRAAANAHPSLAYRLAQRVLLLTRMLESDETQIEFLRRELNERTASRGPDASPRS